jgi:vitamin B12 transporter
MHFHAPSLLAAAIAVASFPVSADNTFSDSEPLRVIVTANRTPQPLESTSTSTSVITAREIEQRQIQTVAQALQELPGVHLTQQGNAASLSSLFIRGTNSDHVLVLVDGVRIGSATSGTTAFQYLSVGAIERIELVRGGRSSLYGSDAIGGVLQIFTKQGSARPSARIEASLGHNDYRRTRADFSSQFRDAGKIYVGISRELSDGFDAKKDVQPDADGYNKSTFNLAITDQLTDNLDLAFKGSYWQGDVEYDNEFGADETHFDNHYAALTGSWKNESLTSAITFGTAVDDSYDDGNGVTKQNASTFHTERQFADWRNRYQVNTAVRVLSGIEYQHEDISDSSDSYELESRKSIGVYLGTLIALGNTDFDVSLRHQHDEQFGNKMTYGAGIVRHLSDSLRFNVNVGSSFKAPTFTDLYYPGFFGQYAGNPNLKPESALNYEIGFAGNLLQDKMQWSATVYQLEIEDLITFDSAPPHGMTNIGKARTRGIELHSSLVVGSMNYEFSYDYMDTEDLETGNELARRPRHSAVLSASWQRDSLNIGTDWRYTGSRYNDGANTVELEAYNLVNLYAGYQITPAFSIGLRANNLFDETYESVAGYNTAGRTLIAQVTYQF